MPSIEIDAGFKDILENLDLAAMVFAELRYRKFAAYADIVYTKITADAETPAQILFEGIDVENTLFIGTFGAGYRALEGERGFLDLLAGARAWSVDTRLDFDGGLLADREIESNQNWVDPVAVSVPKPLGANVTGVPSMVAVRDSIPPKMLKPVKLNGTTAGTLPR